MNWFKKLIRINQPTPELASSILYNEATFYKQFVRDLEEAKEEIIIESPFITTKRLKTLIPTFEKLVKKNIQIVILTRNPLENDPLMAEQAESGIQYFENLGIQVLLVTGGHHRKLAMIDRTILWEGSLNILSQTNSREFMRRVESRKLTSELFTFLRFDKIALFDKKSSLV